MTKTNETKSELLEALDPMLKLIGGRDLGDADELLRMLESLFPTDGGELERIHDLCLEGLEEGWLCDREKGAAKFSRLAKASDDTHGVSIDVVLSSGEGVEHTHTKGEVDLCFVEEGSATFDGHGAGWIVYPPGSRHSPDVEGGKMLILYFLPDGEIEWH